MHIVHDRLATRFHDPEGGPGVARADDQPRDPRDPQLTASESAPAPPAPGPSTHTLASSAGGESEGGGSVDKIRDIIFGVQMRDYDARFARLEERLLKESAALREDANRRFDALEAVVKQQVEALGERLASEAGSRAHAVQELAQRITDLVHHVEQRTRQIDDQAGQSQRTLQQQLHEQASTLTMEIGTRFDALSATLDRQTGALRDEKADRASLASLLTEVARRLHPESSAGSSDPGSPAGAVGSGGAGGPGGPGGSGGPGW